MKNNRCDKAAALTAEQFAALLEAAPSAKYRAMWSVQRWTAARIGETLALSWGDVRGKQVFFKASTTKTKVPRPCPQGPTLQQELAQYRQAWAAEHGHQPSNNESLFPASGSTTQSQSRQAADKALRACCLRLGLEGVSLHSFRRTAAQDAVKRGLPLHVVMKMTGHKSLGSLGEYLEATPEEVLAAIGA